MKAAIIISLVLILGFYAFQNKDELAAKIKDILNPNAEPDTVPDTEPDTVPGTEPPVIPEPPVLGVEIKHLQEIGKYTLSPFNPIIAVQKDGKFYHAVKLGNELHIKGFNFAKFVGYTVNVLPEWFAKEETAFDGVVMPQSFSGTIPGWVRKTRGQSEIYFIPESEDQVVDAPIIDIITPPNQTVNVNHLEEIGTYKQMPFYSVLAVQSPNGKFYHALKVGERPYQLHVKGINIQDLVAYKKTVNLAAFDQQATEFKGIDFPSSFGKVLSGHTYKDDINGKYFQQNGMFQITPPTDSTNGGGGVDNNPTITGGGGGSVIDPAIGKFNAFDKIDKYDTTSYAAFKDRAFFAKSVRGYELTNNEEILDLYDYNPILHERIGTNVFTNWSQAYIFATNRTSTYVKHGGKYFVKPDYQPSSDILMNFDRSFPNITLANGKWNVMQCQPLRDREPSNYLRKGCTFVREHGDPRKKFKFLGDAIFYELGCPMAYQSSQRDMDEWCKNVSASQLLENFKRHVLQFKDWGYIMINGEAINHRWHYNREKLVACFRWWAEEKKRNNYYASLSVWNFAALKFSRENMSSERTNRKYEDALNFTGSLGEFKNTFGSWINTDNADIAEFLDVFHVGGYTNSVTDDLTLHHYLLEYDYNKKYFPEKKILKTHWSTIEKLGVPNNPLALQIVEGQGMKYIRHVKPQVLTSDMYNIGSWTVGYGDGQDEWYDPYFASDNKQANGWDGHPWLNNTWSESVLPLRYIAGGEYPKGRLSNIDMKMSAIWAASQNNDILNGSGGWKYLINPAQSMRERKPIVAYKANAAGILVKATDTFAEAAEIKRFGVEIGGQALLCETNGNFTSEIRF